MDIVFLTGNEWKLKEFNQILGIEMRNMKVDIEEIQDLNPEVVAEDKCKKAYEVINAPVLTEDTSLIFHAWNKLPGTLIKWFDETVSNEGLVKMLDGFSDRSASAITTISYYDGNEIHHFQGIVKGTIATEPKGTDGFGWDSIFSPAGYDGRTNAEIGQDEKNKASSRRFAINKFKAFLESNT